MQPSSDTNEGSDEKREKLRNDLALYARTGKIDKASAAIDALGGDINYESGGTSLLMDAAHMGHDDMIRLLLKRGAHVNYADVGGRTALMVAAFRCQMECVEALLEGGADANARNDMGQTACDLARDRCGDELVERLAAVTADPWKGADPGRLEKLDPALARAVVKVIRDALAHGNRGWLQSTCSSLKLPFWYAELLQAVPLAGISFRAKPKGREWTEEGTFLPTEALASIPEEEPYLVQPFLEQKICPIADGNDGNHWVIKVEGTWDSPVSIWSHSGMKLEPAYSSFKAFVKALEV